LSSASTAGEWDVSEFAASLAMALLPAVFVIWREPTILKTLRELVVPTEKDERQATPRDTKMPDPVDEWYGPDGDEKEEFDVFS
jgi:hypothetical protein